jgi:hypothetical protein
MRLAALFVAIFTIGVGIVGIVSPDGGMTIRRLYYETPGRFYTVGAVRVAMGLVLILAASSWPKTLRVLGAIMCLQATAATFLGLERARTIMEWEGMQGSTLLRAGAVVALASGAFMAFAVTKGQRNESMENSKVAHYRNQA